MLGIVSTGRWALATAERNGARLATDISPARKEPDDQPIGHTAGHRIPGVERPARVRHRTDRRRRSVISYRCWAMMASLATNS